MLYVFNYSNLTAAPVSEMHRPRWRSVHVVPSHSDMAASPYFLRNPPAPTNVKYCGEGWGVRWKKPFFFLQWCIRFFNHCTRTLTNEFGQWQIGEQAQNNYTQWAGVQDQSVALRYPQGSVNKVLVQWMSRLLSTVLASLLNRCSCNMEIVAIRKSLQAKDVQPLFMGSKTLRADWFSNNSF